MIAEQQLRADLEVLASSVPSNAFDVNRLHARLRASKKHRRARMATCGFAALICAAVGLIAYTGVGPGQGAHDHAETSTHHDSPLQRSATRGLMDPGCGDGAVIGNLPGHNSTVHAHPNSPFGFVATAVPIRGSSLTSARIIVADTGTQLDVPPVGAPTNANSMMSNSSQAATETFILSGTASSALTFRSSGVPAGTYAIEGIVHYHYSAACGGSRGLEYSRIGTLIVA